MLTLAEELLLVTYDDQKGTLSSSASMGLPYGIAGAVLMDLAQLGVIEYKDKKVTFLPGDIQDELLKELFVFLTEKDEKHSKQKDLSYWVSVLGHRIQSKKYRGLFLKRLLAKDILTKVEKKVLFFFKTTTYPSTNSGIEDDIRNKIQEAVYSTDDTVDERTILLLSLLKACGSDHLVFEKEEYKDAKKKVKQLLENQPYGKAVSDTIQALQVAIITTVIAASTVTTTTTITSN